MENLFNPKSIAVIGASRHPEKLGYQVLDNIVSNGYTGHIYPVNPEAKSILNLTSYSKINDIPESVDLAVIIVPSPIVPEILKECVAKNVKNAVILSAGFAEIGPAGAKLQQEIKNIIEVSSIRVLGPNCLGLFNTNLNFNATFAAPKLIKGGVSAVFQSGALGVALFDWAQKYNFGFSKFVSLGNKVDIEEAEIIEYLNNDPDTKVIALYLEQIANPLKFLNVCQNTSLKKPIVILKGGTTNLGAKAAFSHTAAMVGSAQTTKAIFAQSNLIIANTIEEMLNLIQILSSEPPMKNKSVAIITNAGGPGILAVDMAERVGVAIPPLCEKSAQKLKKSLSNIASINNPIDMGGEAKAKDYESAVESALDDSNFASLLVLLTPQTATEVEATATVLAKYAQSSKPIIASFLGDRAVASGVEILRHAKVPHLEDPELAIYAISKIAAYWQKINTPHYLVELTNNQALEMLGEPLDLVCRYNIPVPPSGMATNWDIALKIAGRIGFPVAVKNISPNIVHKFKAGKVVLNVPSESYLKEAIDKIDYPVLIQRMVEAPFEVIVGAKRDSQLGVLVTFGWGGIFVEDLQDISTRILPLTENDLEEMIKETKIGQVLTREKVDTSMIKNILIEVCQIMMDFPQISEMDLNPIKLTQKEAYCVDARYKIQENRK